MAGVAFKGGRLWLDEWDISAQISAATLEYSADVLDGTGLTDTNRTRVGGFRSVTLGYEGYWLAGTSDVAAIDDAVFDAVGSSNAVVTLLPYQSTEGARAFTFRALHTEYSPGGTIGELFGVSVAAEGDDVLAQATVLRHSTAESADANGTAFNLGGSGGRTVYAAWHVFSEGSGSTAASITVSIQSDGSSSFASPTTRISFAATTAAGAQWMTAAGTTDTWWRAVITMAGTSASATFHHGVVVGFSSGG